MSAIWPAGLPQKFDKEDFNEKLGDNVITTNMDSGPPKKRRRFTAAIDDISGKMFMTREQANTLETFYRVTCADGTVNVEMNHPRKGTPAVLQWAAAPGLTPELDGINVSLAFKVMP